MRARDTLHVANLEAQGYSHFCKLTPFTGKLARVQGFYSCFFFFSLRLEMLGYFFLTSRSKEEDELIIS